MALRTTGQSVSVCTVQKISKPARAPKRPEIMIEAEGERPIVIERKAVVWPPKFQRDHSKEHYLPEQVTNLLGDNFRDSVYQLEFCSEDLREKSWGKLTDLEAKLRFRSSRILARPNQQEGLPAENQ